MRTGEPGNIEYIQGRGVRQRFIQLSDHAFEAARHLVRFHTHNFQGDIQMRRRLPGEWKVFRDARVSAFGIDCEADNIRLHFFGERDNAARVEPA